MNQHISSIGDAYQKYFEAACEFLLELNSSGGLQTKAADLAMEKLKEQYELLHSDCDKTEAFIDTMKQQIWELGVPPHYINAMDPNIARSVSLRPANAQKRECKSDLESDARYGVAADASEESDTASSKIMNQLGLSNRVWIKTGSSPSCDKPNTN